MVPLIRRWFRGLRIAAVSAIGVILLGIAANIITGWIDDPPARLEAAMELFNYWVEYRAFWFVAGILAGLVAGAVLDWILAKIERHQAAEALARQKEIDNILSINDLLLEIARMRLKYADETLEGKRDLRSYCNKLFTQKIDDRGLSRVSRGRIDVAQSKAIEITEWRRSEFNSIIRHFTEKYKEYDDDYIIDLMRRRLTKYITSLEELRSMLVKD